MVPDETHVADGESADLPAGEDLEDGGDVGNPGCLEPTNVVAAGLELEVEVDLTRFADREYGVRQRIVVEPEAPGTSISFYGAALLMGEASAPYRYDGNLVTFCPGAFDAGESVAIDVEFVISEAHQGFPPGSLAGMRIWGQTSSDFVIGPFSSPYFASTWILAPQTMNWFSAVHDGNVIAERFALSVLVPDAGWTVIGPGVATVDGDLWAFELDQPAPLYTLSFAASPKYDLVQVESAEAGVEFIAGVTPASKPDLLLNLDAAAAAVDWMSNNVGPFPWEIPLGFAEIPTFSGGMEHTGAIWLGSAVLDGGDTGDYVAVHEAVHHWWGNHVQIADWPHFWLSEGMTDWTTLFAILEDSDPATAKDRQDYYRKMAASSSYPQTPGAPMPGPLRFDDQGDIMTQVANNLLFFYYYGAAFLEMVDQRLQRDFETDLVQILQAWYAGYGGALATTEDLLALLAEQTGDSATWDQLFAEWVYVGPAPTLEIGDYGFAEGQATLTVSRTGGADQDLPDLEVVFVQGGESVSSAAALPAGVDVVTVQGVTGEAPDAIVIDPQGLYILRLDTAPGFDGPSVGRSL